MSSGWTVPVDQIALRLGMDVEEVVRRATFNLFSSVVERSPVDTGRFKSNWNVAFAEPNFTITASTAQARALDEVNKVLTLPVGGTVYLANGLPYAQRLEYGWSKQAPAGMVRLSVFEFQQHIKRALARFKR